MRNDLLVWLRAAQIALDEATALAERDIAHLGGPMADDAKVMLNPPDVLGDYGLMIQANGEVTITPPRSHLHRAMHRFSFYEAKNGG